MAFTICGGQRRVYLMQRRLSKHLLLPLSSHIRNKARSETATPTTTTQKQHVKTFAINKYANGFQLCQVAREIGKGGLWEPPYRKTNLRSKQQKSFDVAIFRYHLNAKRKLLCNDKAAAEIYGGNNCTVEPINRAKCTHMCTYHMCMV